MLLTLALMAQTVLLEPGDHDAALSCAGAIRVSYTVPTIENNLPAMYFIHVAASDGDPREMKNRLEDMSKQARSRAEAIGSQGTAAAIVQECRARFPLAWNVAPATLPNPAFERAVMCTVSAASYYGMLKPGALQGSEQEIPRADRLFKRFVARLQANTPGQPEANDIPLAFGRGLIATLKLGNLRSIVSACEIAYPS